MSRPARLNSFDYVGEHSYFVTCCAHKRNRVFVEADVVGEIWREMVWTCEERYFRSRMAVFMPDHVHFLVSGAMANAEFVPFMKVLRQRTAVIFRRLKNERLWQSGYYERVLRPHDSWSDMVAYIRSNPVLAGLADNWETYPFCFEGHSETPISRVSTPSP